MTINTQRMKEQDKELTEMSDTKMTAGTGPVVTVPDGPSNIDHQIEAERALFIAIKVAAQRHDADAAEKYAAALRVIYRD